MLSPRHVSSGLALAFGLALTGGGALAGKAEDSLTIAVTSFGTNDPGASRGGFVVGNVYSALTRIDDAGAVVGELAESWEAEEGAKVWTFRLRPGARFADGSPLDAEAVVWNVERVRDPANALANNRNLETLTGAEALDAATVRFTTSEPYLDLPRRFSMFHFLPKGWNEGNNAAVATISSGAYELVEFENNTRAVFRRNDAHFGDKAAIGRIVAQGVTNPATLLNQLRAREVDVAFNVEPFLIPQVKAFGGYQAGAVPNNNQQILRINQNNPALRDPRVRKAISLAIDRKAITDSVYLGLIEPGPTTVLGPLFKGYDGSLTPSAYDPAEARRLLAEAGHEKGLKLELAYATAGFVGAPAASQAIAAQLGAVGITTTTRAVPSTRWTEFMFDKTDPADLIFVRYSDLSVSSPTILEQFKTAAPQTRGPASAEYDAAVDAAKNAATEAEQVEHVRKALSFLRDENLVVYLWPNIRTYVIAEGVDWPVRQEDTLRFSDAAFK